MERLTTLMFVGGLTLLCYVIILGFIFCDLSAGISKAKKRGEYRTSEGLKRTIEKISKYFNMTFALSLIDVVQIALIFFLYQFYKVDIFMVPWFTFIATGYVGYVEIKSIWEPADIKERKQQQDYRRALMALIHEYGGLENVLKSMTKEGLEKAAQEETYIENSDL